jgi:hypothetical protein
LNQEEAKPIQASASDTVGEVSKVVIYAVGVTIVGALIGLPLVLLWEQIPLNIRIWLDIRLLFLLTVGLGISLAAIYRKFKQ